MKEWVMFAQAQAPTLLYFVEKFTLTVAYTYMKPCIGKGVNVNVGPEAGYTDWGFCGFPHCL
jgi:hypothetical protein